ncbi:hypothetical protein PG999_001741 [Apiospora kogelbergensis]|uniref:DUF3176 domain containing protein n=1 Tax=Apiospora kogelbergensis TaxID=1337665 RepID=A0AAW0R6C6_9PEZI
MERTGSQRTHRYGLACSQAPSQNLCDPGPAGEQNWQPPDEERHGLVHGQVQPHTQRSSPPLSDSDTDTTVNGSQEETADHGRVPRDSTSIKAVTRWRRVRNANENYWLTEIGSCLIAFIVLVAIVCVLRRYDDHLLPDWRYGITLNALVSVLSSILKAAAVLPLAGGISQTKWLWYAKSRPLKDMESFDDASRGPWGSLLLMLDFRSHYVASFGAFLTVIAMAVDPFTQQVVQTQACLLKDDLAVARIPRANIYNKSDLFYYDDWGRDTMYPALTQAMYSGIISPPNNISAIITPICPTGNCTFPEFDGKAYQSIAVCHQCDDITDRVQNNTKFDYENPKFSQWNYSLPSGLNLTSSQSLSTTIRISDPRKEASLFEMEVLMYTRRSGPDVGELESIQPGMHLHLLGARCSLIPPLRTILSMDKRRLLLVGDTLSPNLGDWQCDSTQWDMPAANVDANREFSEAASLQINKTLADLYMDGQMSFRTTPLVSEGSIWLHGLYGGSAADMSSVNHFIGALADSITQHIRTEGFRAPETWAEGSVFVERTCVHVGWPWLAFPAALLVLVSVFIGLTVLTTRRTRWREDHGLTDDEAAARVGFIKSNPLALLFFSLHRDVLDEAQRPDTTVGMQDVAENIEVALNWCWIDGQWQFVKAKSE